MIEDTCVRSIGVAVLAEDGDNDTYLEHSPSLGTATLLLRPTQDFRLPYQSLFIFLSDVNFNLECEIRSRDLLIRPAIHPKILSECFINPRLISGTIASVALRC